MIRQIAYTFALVVVISSPLSALTITINDHFAPAGTTTFDIPVLVTGGEDITDMAGAIYVEAGHPHTGAGTIGPEIVGASLIGSIWEPPGVPGGSTLIFDDSLEPDTVVFPNISTDIGGEMATADGLLFTFTLDLSGFSVGETFTLTMDESAFPTTFQDMGDGVPATFNGGSITIIPEPAACGLLVIGILGLALFGWQARRRMMS